MPTNGFLPNSTGVGAVVLNDADYAASDAITQGAQVGELPPQYYNKVNRQTSVIASMIGQFIVDNAAVDANDSQSIATLEGNFILGLKAVLTGLATSVATTVYKNMPPVQQIFVDPVNGSETNDGTTSSKARKDLDTVLDEQKNVGTAIILLNNAQLIRRRNVYAFLAIYGAQISGNAQGWTATPRVIQFIGTATNSPLPDGSTFGSGFWLDGPTFVTDQIIWSIPTQAPSQTYNDHIRSEYGTGVLIVGSTLNVAETNAGFLLGASAATVPFDSFLDIGLNAGAPGHLFRGVIAGANPNTLFQYRSNVTSA
ncbi:hypothetical protein CIW48_27215 [Methylobacterium sp. P1-11]|uniref:hypothetical protein n=1 Tax=Methylobacterium sp. P1-11 TaxID=2024616 RepID=UPI0011EC2BFA|nr:hypothetical protein [Methylobacterium sp. P1-11]KAA0117893.1 hypothetical protein CIW48_27215 [Methylobacterium sp. P1-11]